MNKSLFLFRRDFRLQDNTGLIAALKSSKTVIPAFIFTPEQIEQNPYRSDHCVKFMIESLNDLSRQLENKGGKLYFFKGKPEEVLLKCISELKIEAVFVNRDYTPYSRARDAKLEKACSAHSIPFYSFDDALLHPPEDTLKKTGRPYSIFTPYFRNALKLRVPSPTLNEGDNYFHGSIPFAVEILAEPQVKTTLKGGRTEALKVLKNLTSFTQYEHFRNFPDDDTTHLSPYLKFTVCSPREVYAAIAEQLTPHHELIRALYWRDFFTGIGFFFPHVFQGAFHPKYDQLKWSSDKKAFTRWCEGMTGFPIVDAGMRELNETGFMHNRVRMIVASFLTKDLHINWRWGEKYFAEKLIDYDPAVNNGNWQWAASTGCDAQPYFRIFNPWRQQEKFDPECRYIKKWVPEFQSSTYPAPMVDHEQASKEALNAFKSLGFQ